MTRPRYRAAVLLLLASLSCSVVVAQTPPASADFDLNVHVSSSELQTFGGTSSDILQILHVSLSGKQYILAGNAITADVKVIGPYRAGLLPIGDYKARLMPHKVYKPAYLNFDVYELQLPDGRSHEFRLIGQHE